MSDFLGRLVARHEAGPSIVPRVVSRFEQPFATITWDSVMETAAQPAEQTPARPAAAFEHVGDPTKPEAQRAQSTPTLLKREPAERERPATSLPVWPAVTVRDRVTVESGLADGNSSGGDEPTARATPMPRSSRFMHELQPRTLSSHQLGGVMNESMPAEPNVVHVHIGLVEVHAVKPVAAAPLRAAKQRETPKPMSLDRYLSDRDRS